MLPAHCIACRPLQCCLLQCCLLQCCLLHVVCCLEHVVRCMLPAHCVPSVAMLRTMITSSFDVVPRTIESSTSSTVFPLKSLRICATECAMPPCHQAPGNGPPATGAVQSTTCNRQQTTCNMPTCNMHQTTCNRQHATCYRQHATYNRQHAQHATDNRHHAIDDMQQTTCNRQHATDNMQHATDNMPLGSSRTVLSFSRTPLRLCAWKIAEAGVAAQNKQTHTSADELKLAALKHTKRHKSEASTRAPKPHTHAHAHTRTRTHTRTHTHAHTHARTHRHARTRTHARARTHTHMECGAGSQGRCLPRHDKGPADVPASTHSLRPPARPPSRRRSLARSPAFVAFACGWSQAARAGTAAPAPPRGGARWEHGALPRTPVRSTVLGPSLD